MDDTPPNLLELVSMGDVTGVRRELETTDINIRDHDTGATALSIAAENGHSDVVELLISEEGVDVSATDNEGDTALHRAAWNGHSSIVEALIEIGADVRARNNEGDTALHHAAIAGHLNVVEALIKRKADVNAENKAGFTALGFGVQEMLTIVVETLLREGADVNVATNLGGTALHSAAFNGDLYVVEELIKHGADVNAQGTEGRGALHDAARNGHQSVVEALIKKGANVSSKTNEGETPLFAAVRSGHLPVVDILLQSGADVHATDKTGETALFAAVDEESLPVVDLLLEKGADVNAADDTGRTAIMIAAEGGYLEIVSSLLSHGADVHRSDDSHESALQRAAMSGNLSVVKILVERILADNPSFFEQSDDGTSAEDYARYEGHADVANYLNKVVHGEIDTTLQPIDTNWSNEFDTHINALSTDALENVNDPWLQKYLLNPDVCDMHFRDEEGMTLLHNAVEKNKVEAIKFLLRNGAFATAITYAGVTPLDLAIAKGHKEAAEEISKHIQAFNENKLCNEREQSHYHSLMLHLIQNCVGIKAQCVNDVKSREKRLEATKNVSMMLSSGVPLIDPASQQISPLYLAITTSCTPILSLLLAAGAPLYATKNGFGPIQTAHFTPESTPWVKHIVTQAVIRQLEAEINYSYGDHHDELLKDRTRELIEKLEGESPWRAKFPSTSIVQEDIDRLLVTACKRGATLVAWYVWEAGGCFFTHDSNGMTALHAALNSEQFHTAEATVLHMEANPFLQDTSGRLPIDLFPEENRQHILKKLMLVECQVLERRIQTAVSDRQTKMAKEMLILYIVLFLFRKHGNELARKETKWMQYYRYLIGEIEENQLLNPVEENEELKDWILLLDERLKDHISEIQAGRKKYIKQDRSSIKQSLKDIDNSYEMSKGDEGLNDLIDSIDSFIKVSTELEVDLVEIDERQTAGNTKCLVGELLIKGLKLCSLKRLSLFLHILVDMALIDVDVVVNAVCGTSALHHAAIFDNMSSAFYLVSKGAKTTKQDRFGHVACHFAYMHGNVLLGKYLATNARGMISKSGLRGTDFWAAHEKYLELYLLDKNHINTPEFEECRNSDILTNLHLVPLKARWADLGIKEAVNRAKVDYTSGESLAVSNAVKATLRKLIDAMGEVDSTFEGDLIFVGSSADNVRLITPDEYDCNVVLRNFSGYPGEGCKVSLSKNDGNSNPVYHNTTIEVFFERDDLKDLFQGKNLNTTMYRLVVKCLPKLTMGDSRLCITPPAVRLIRVGVGLRFMWTGKEFPLLFIDIDIVPVIKAPWPKEYLPRRKLMPDSIQEVYLVNAEGKWQFSFAKAEREVMQRISDKERLVFLACKLAVTSLKTEGWMPQAIKNRFKYWDSQKFRIPLPKGFILKNAFFLEKEFVTEEDMWEESKLRERMCSVFKRMCREVIKDDETVLEDGRVPAYFQNTTQDSSLGFGAPLIYKFLRNWMED